MVEKNNIIEQTELFDQIRAGIFGLLVGDALGVPVEFESRESLKLNPVTNMREYGAHYQPAGTWSDDGSMALCITDALSDGKYDIETICKKFLGWFTENEWTPHGEIFDIGGTTKDSLAVLERFRNYKTSGMTDSQSNGNGSLMRCLPLLFIIKDLHIHERFTIIKEVSSITHAHILSVLCNFFYLEFAKGILDGKDKFSSYTNTQKILYDFIVKSDINPKDILPMERILTQKIEMYTEDEIKSTGYVIDTLEASIWAIMTTDNFESAVLKAVNLGSDTDTTGAVTGGLAGLLYGYNSIPLHWKTPLAKYIEISQLLLKFSQNLHLANENNS
jgi:ADP-ribosylglycohydrolase